MKTAFFATMLVAAAAAGSVSLTGANFDDEVFGAGKGAFIKFQAPWCGHCKKMKPDWEKLGDQFADSKTVLIGDVDCTVEKDVCGKYGVRGYPTIKYFTSSTAADGDKYEGGRDFDSLLKFATESLGPSCGPSNKDLCNAEQLAALEAVEALSADERAAQIAAKEQEIADAEQLFKDELAKLQAAYEKLNAHKEATIAAVQPSLRLLKMVSKPAAASREEL